MARDRLLLRAPHDAAYQLKSVRDWTTLGPGQLVVVLQEFAREMRGRVDTVTEDGGVLWLHLEGAGDAGYLQGQAATGFGG